jgi:p-aminobenzoyl-glutamate transporter AbgT
MIFKRFSPKNLAKIVAVFAQTSANFCKNLIMTLVFEKSAKFFAETCDHNIDPWTIARFITPASEVTNN